MKILGLYNNECALELFQWMEGQGHRLVLWKDRLEQQWCREQHFDLAVSYTYRHILSGDVLEALGGNAVNVHNSFLPFNRGADPNLWSILDGSPRGVTLHYVNAELDKGDIICQTLVMDIDGAADETLESAYDNLHGAALHMFQDAFRYYDFWPEMRKKALGKGSYHAVKDALKMKEAIRSYDVPISAFKESLGGSGGYWADRLALYPDAPYQEAAA